MEQNQHKTRKLGWVCFLQREVFNFFLNEETDLAERIVSHTIGECSVL